MKKTYIVRLAVVACLVLAGLNSAYSQNFVPFTRTQLYSWSTPFESYEYTINAPTLGYLASPMRFRLLKPNDFDTAPPGTKFPLIVFFHGSGEAAPYPTAGNAYAMPQTQNNEIQLVHGGQTHLNAVRNTPVKFNGLLLYPQMRKAANGSNNWGADPIEAVIRIIEKLISDYKVDPDRIYVHGLSGGGEATYTAISMYPRLFAAAHPMSAAEPRFYNGVTANMNNYVYMPLRSSQGGLDTNPLPSEGNDQVQQIRSIGGNIRYAYYPSLGHGTWNSEYAKADFFPWFNAQRKYNPVVLGGRTSFCTGDAISVTLALTPGFTAYQWTKDDADLDGLPVLATGNSIVVTTPGLYRARFSRSGVWTPWSDPIDINYGQAPSATPTIATNGQSTTLPSLDGRPDVTLFGPLDKLSYDWVRGVTSVGTLDNYIASVGGSYTLKIKDKAATGFAADGVTPTEYRGAPAGCLSLPSTPVCVTTTNTLDAPAPVGNFFASTVSLTSVQINWDDRSADETGFEIYRTTTPGSGYVLIAKIAATAGANPQLYTDNGLQANTTYYYRMRAINCNGGSAYSSEAAVTTVMDTTPPASPVLSVASTSRTVINLTWTVPADNVGVFEYDVYQNGALIGTTTTPSYGATGLVALATYNYVVKARDRAGNPSAPSNQVTATAANTGLFYRYYTHLGITSVNQIETDAFFVKSGSIANFSLTPKTQSDNFAFIYEGFINIPTTGNYTFYLTSDDGSSLYINNVLNVLHDGAHGATEKAGTVINLSAGTYPIKVLFFEIGGGESLTVKWAGPGISKVAIPDAALRDNVTPPAALTNPSNLGATAISNSAINFTWKDNSSNETGFEVYRSTSSNGTYLVVGTAPAGAGTGTTRTYNDTGLLPAQSYYYRVRAINATSASSIVGTANATTMGTGATPAVPTGLAASPITATRIDLSWSNVTGETGYEIQRSSNATTGFVSIATVAADVLTYNDLSVTGHTTLYYKIRSRGFGSNHSAYSAAVSATTPNRAPTISDIPNQTVTAGSGTPVNINALVSDADGDPITFSFPNGPLPTGVTPDDDGYGRLTLTAQGVPTGTYNIRVQGSDGITTVFDDFVLTANTNQAPVVQDVQLDAGTITPMTTIPALVTQEGRTLKVTIRVTDTSAPTFPNNTQLTVAPVVDFSGAAAFSAIGSPAYAINAGNTAVRTLVLNFTPPTTGAAGIYNLSVTFRDNAGGINVQNFTLTVLPLDKQFNISVNFTDNLSYYEAAPWNNSGAPGTVLQNMKDESNNTVPFVKFTFVQGTAFTTTLPTAGAIYTKKVRESGFRKNSATIGATFSGLNPSLRYKITVYGAFPDGVARNTLYKVNGVNLPELNTNNNVADTRTSAAYIAPDASGNIVVTAGLGTGNTGNYYINSVILTALLLNDPTPPIAPSDLVLTAPLNNRVNLDWHDNSTNETSFEIQRSLSAAGPFDVISTVAQDVVTAIDNTVTGRITYYYRIRAFNAYGESFSNVAIVTTPNGAPGLANPGTIIVKAGQVLQKNISSTDPEGDAVSFSVLNLPAFATLVDNGNGTGFIRFAPQVTDIGAYTLTLKSTDAFTASTQIPFNVQVLDTEFDESVYINFTGAGTASDQGAPWNNKNLASYSPTLVNSIGVASAITITATAPATWAGAYDTGVNGGLSTGSNTGVYPDKVLQSGWTTNTITNTSTLTLAGLDPAKKHNIAIVGSRNEIWFANTIYTITTGTPAGAKTLNISKNTSNIVRFTGISPNASGNIVISVKRDPANYKEVPPAPQVDIVHKNAAINGMVIEAYTEGLIPRRPTNLVARGISKTAIRLSWYDNSSDETGFQIYRSESQAGPFTLINTVTTETYDDTGRPQNKAYVYRVRAVKASGNSDYTNDAIASTFDKIVQLNINSHPGSGDLQAPSPPWNNTADGNPMPGSLYNNLIDISGVATTMDMEIVTFGNGGVLNGGYTNGMVEIYPDAVNQNYWYYLPNDPIAEYKLKDLDLTKSYDLTFFSDEWNFTQVGAIMATRFMAGGYTMDLFNGRNTTETVTAYGLGPDPDGTLSFQMRAQPDAATTAGTWNAIVVSSYTPLSASFDTEAPSVPTGLVASEIGDESVRLSWLESIDNVGVAGYEIFEGSNLVLTVGDTTGVVINLQPSTLYLFSVRAFDVKGNRSGFSSAIQVTTLPSTDPATIYFSIPVGDLTSVSSWETTLGATPANFTNANQHFVLNRNATLAAPLTISGFNSKMIINNGAQLTLGAVLTAPVEIGANAQVIVNVNTPPNFTTIDPTSTITFSGNPNAVPGANYGNLVLSGENSTKTFNAGTYQVNGNLSIEDDLAINGSVGNTTQLNIAGNLTIAGTPTMAQDNQLFAVNFNSGANQTLNALPTSVRFFQLKVTNNTQLAVTGAGAVKTNVTLGTSTGGGLTIDPGSSLTLGKHGLTIQGLGAINGNNETGQLRVSKAAISINSTGNQVHNLYFTASADTVAEMNLNASSAGQVNIRTKMLVSDKVDIQNGRLNSAGNVVLVSSPTATARIAPIRNAGAIIGSIEFQRYVSPKGRVYRYISTPVFGTKVADWQNTMEVIGPFTGSQNLNAANSLYYFDESAGLLENGWVAYPVASNQEGMLVGRGYSIFTFSTSGSRKLRISGPTQQGNYEYTDYISFNTGSSIASDDGWNLLGNPYASPIQWNNGGWQMTGFTGSVYVRSNAVVGNTTQGGFKTWNGSVGDLDFKGIIAQGQSFWVKADGSATPYIQLTEDAKYDTLAASLFRVEEPVNHMTISMSNGNVTDNTFIHFREQATDLVEASMDAVKRPNSYFDLYTIANGTKLAINSLAPEFCEKSVPLNFDRAAAGSYTLKFTNISSFTYAASIRVVDHFTGTQTPVSDGSQYAFTVTSDPASYNARFEIIVGKPTLDTAINVEAATPTICEGSGDAAIRLVNSQAGVTYNVMRNGTLITSVNGTGNEVNAVVGASALEYGLNTFTVTAAFPGCSEVQLTTLAEVRYTQTFNAIASDKVICEDQSASLKASGAPEGSTYTWYASATANEVLETNTTGVFTTPVLFKNADYYVSVNSNGCESMRKPVAITVEHLTVPVILVQGDELISSAENGNQWKLNDEPLAGETAAILKPRATGIYTVAVAEGACVKLSAPVDFVITGFENDPSEALTLHPNPVKDRIRLTMPASVAVETPVAITLYNAQGIIVEKYGKVNKEAGIEIMATELSSGFYTMFIEVNGKVVQRRFIKE